MPTALKLWRSSFRSFLVLWGLVLAPSLGPLALQAAPPASMRGAVHSLDFTSGHHLLCHNLTDLLEEGERYPEVEWVSEPPRNVPITHTGGTTTRIRARITLEVEGVAVDTPYQLEGTSKERALCFRKQGRLSSSSQAVLDIVALHPLGPMVRKIEESIRWQLTVHPGKPAAKTIDLGTTGSHRVYTTLGTPRDTNDPLHRVTDIRMELAVDRIGAAMAKAGASASPPRLLLEVMKQIGHLYMPTRHYGGKNAWKLPETWEMTPRGASCISIAEFVVLIGKMVGMEGTFTTTAFYARSAKPLLAVEGGLGDDPEYKKGEDGGRWQLFLVDESNSKDGQVGGVGGMNYYEAVLKFEYQGKQFFFPGGTKLVYAVPDKVLTIFRTLAWAQWEESRRDWVVREVVHIYSRPGDKEPPSVSLP